jgi:hypothetical protein
MKAGGQRVERQRLMDYSSRRGGSRLSSADYFAAPLPHQLPSDESSSSFSFSKINRKVSMKSSCIVFAFLASTLAGVQAQFSATGATAIANQPALPAPTAFSAVSRDGGSTVWERTVYERGPNGTIVPRKSRYTELSSGLNYRDQNTGQWTPSREQIDLLPAGGAFAAAATHGQHSARFPLDISTGVIQLSTPEGKQLTSRPVGLFYEDNNNSVLIAILTNSVGELVGSNSVVYPEAFEGAAASIRYTYTKAGFEQDVVVQGQLPDPSALGLNAARTRLGVLTAFFDTNNPVATPGPTDPQTALSDATLRFGSMTMTKGRAFSIGNGEQTPPLANMAPAAWQNWLTNAAQRASADGSPTFKRWFQSSGHNFLMEEIPYRQVAAQLRQLPPMTGRLSTTSTNLLAADSFLDAVPVRLLSPAASGASGGTQAMRLSRADGDPSRALVLDYVMVNPGNYYSSYTFQGDTTYLVSGACYFLGNVTFEGGTVIKYPSVNSVSQTPIGPWNATAFIAVDGTVTCKTSSYHPAVFTAVDDNSIGQSIGNGYPTGNYYANPAIYAPSGASLSNVRINYADLAFMTGDSGSLTLSDSQVNQCYLMTILGLNDGISGPMSLTCDNCLFSGVYYSGLVWDWGGYAADRYCLTNCTVNNFYYLVGYGYANSSYDLGCAANSIFATVYLAGNVAWQGGYNGFYNSFNYQGGGPFGNPANSTSTSPFQTVGGGNYYLADGTFRGKGTTTGVSPSLLADLATKTTYPPNSTYVNQTISSGNFNTHVSRDSLSPGPDLGYHYDPLDYVFQNSRIGINMTFPAGTAVGWQGQGLSFLGSYKINFNGEVNDPCYFVRCNTVQEADGSGDGTVETGLAGSGNYPFVSPVFTRFSALGDLAVFFDADSILAWGDYSADPICNCEFWSGSIGGNVTNAWFLLSNDLLDRTKVSFRGSGNGILAFQNCTFHGGSLAIDAGVALGGNIYDCAFDNTDLTGVNTSYGGDGEYNAYFLIPGNPPGSYLPGSDPITNPHHDVFVSSSSGFNWQRGPLGNFYLPPHDPSANDGRLLIDANNQPGDQQASQIKVIVNGVTDAQEPLSDFTTQTSQQVDSGAVDIGYHYVQFLELTMPCSPRESGVGVELDWSVADILSVNDFKIYRSNVSGGPYTWIATVDGAKRYYWDTGVVSGNTYYYVVTYEYQAHGTTLESPYSNQVSATASLSPTLVAADAFWDVTDVTDTNHPIHFTNLLQAPFGSSNYPAIYNTQLPPINTNWFDCNTWSNHYTLVLPSSWTSQQLAQVKFSFAIDNSIAVYVNNQELNYPDPNHGYSLAMWSPFQPLPNLVAGTNQIGVVISGDCDRVDYFSMVITTNNCSLSGP